MSPLLTKLVVALGSLSMILTPASHLISQQESAIISTSISSIDSALNSALGGSYAGLTNILNYSHQNAATNVPPVGSTTLSSASTLNIFSTPASTSDFVVLKLGSHNVAVAVLQKLLIQKGYLSSAEETGSFDVATQVAVEAYQQAQALPQTGMVAIPESDLASFFLSLSPAFTSLQVGISGSQVTSLQKVLIQQNYLKIKNPTGYFGSATQVAIEAYQAAHSLPQTGIMDQPTFAALNGT